MHIIQTAFGESLRKIRHRKHYPQQQVTMECGMSLRFYKNLEANNKQPSLTTLLRLADELIATNNFLSGTR